MLATLLPAALVSCTIAMSLNLATCNGNERIQRNPEGDFGDTAGAETRLWNCMHKQKSEAEQLWIGSVVTTEVR